MTPGNTKDEIQRLMAGYATGSLNESERRMLYEAVLDDQDLFDQLAGEHSLKELIEVPGVRDRLIAKLGPAEAAQARIGWKRPLAWGLSATFVVGMSLLAVFVTRSSLQQQNQQVAVAQFSAPTVVPVPAAPVVPGSAPSSPEPNSLSVQKTLRDQMTPAPKPASQRTSSPASSVSLDTEGRPSEKKKADVSEASLSKTERGETDRAVNGRLDAPKASAAPPPPPARAVAPASSVVSVEASAAAVQQVAGQLPVAPQVQAQGFVAGQNQQTPQPLPQAAQNQTPQNLTTQDSRIQSQAAGTISGGGGAGGRFRAAPAPLARSAAKDSAPRFAFEYKVEGEDLVFKFTADGYFSLHIAPGGLTIVDSHVAAGTTRREHITNNGTEADIVFSAAPQSSTGGVKLTSNLKADTAEDPGRTRIELLVKFYPPPF